MPSHRTIPRFIPQAATLASAYARGTTVPRDLRHLGQALVTWSLWNLRNDASSDRGNLPARFGFQESVSDAGPPQLSIRLTDHASLRISQTQFTCTHPGGATAIRASRFEPLHVDRQIDGNPAPRPAAPSTAVNWLLAWATITRTLHLLARYERWASDTLSSRARSVQAALRPRDARHPKVSVAELPQALAAMGQWTGDAEQAMLTWVVLDARSRGVEPDIPRI